MAVNNPRDVVQASLAAVLAKYTTSVLKDPTRLRNLLSDRCGEDRQEINILVNALAEGALDHVGNAGDLPRHEAVAKLASHLERQLGLTDDAALWASRTWFESVAGPEARIITNEMLDAWFDRRYRAAKRRAMFAVLTLAVAVVCTIGAMRNASWNDGSRGVFSTIHSSPSFLIVVAFLVLRNRLANLAEARSVELSVRPVQVSHKSQ